MKKYAMLTVKGVIGLLPPSLKSRLKKNAKLTEFYSRSLQRSGLFYGFPSKKKRMAMYKDFLRKQDAVLSGNVSNERVNVVIFGSKNAQATLASLKHNEQVNHVVVIEHETSNVNAPGHGQLRNNTQVVSTFNDAIAALDLSLPLLMLNEGDELTKRALATFVNFLTDYPLVYCDTDKQSKADRPSEPNFFPAWNPDLHFSSAYVSTGVLMSPALLAQLNTSICNKLTTIAQLVARFWLNGITNTIGHVPFTLVHAHKNKAKEKAYLSGVAHEIKVGGRASVSVNNELRINQVSWLSKEQPLVSLIIPTKDAWELVKACIESIQQKTTYTNYEILLIDNGSTDETSLAYFSQLATQPKVRVLPYPGPFNYSAINNYGVKHANGSIIGLVNNDIEVISPNWLTDMVAHAQREDIGCVGAKLLYSDGRIQHAGVVLGYGGGAGHAHKYFPRYHPGYLKRLVATQNYSAVTAACLLVKRSHFDAVGGLDEVNLTVAFNDVDFCLRVRELGVRNLYCAEAELYHHESVSRGLDISPEKAARFNKELRYLKNSWQSIIDADPAYNPNLTRKRENFSLKIKEEY
ncbi:glycosyltransferase [Alteromonas sp. 345S023]|uniref:Glycosyltransferase n=1 Tax=Alteromonas profundi TaxID=2696062 RepID=A0A7X5RLF9_9ALTE|nr:glycosyltransferase family 2 protein [Alteromonas profundi]NDV91679.1 glycosyltransferase [Alteromonas profundi]